MGLKKESGTYRCTQRRKETWILYSELIIEPKGGKAL